MGLRDGQRMMVFYTHIWCFSVRFQGQTRLSVYQGQIQHLQTAVSLCASAGMPQRFNSRALLSPPSGQFLLEESRLLEAAEMAEKAARLDSREFDVVFSAAHMLR